MVSRKFLISGIALLAPLAVSAETVRLACYASFDCGRSNCAKHDMIVLIDTEAGDARAEKEMFTDNEAELTNVKITPNNIKFRNLNTYYSINRLTGEFEVDATRTGLKKYMSGWCERAKSRF